MTKEIEIMRPDAEITAVVRGWNDTHVIYDVWDHAAQKFTSLNFSRPILPFMLDYGLA